MGTRTGSGPERDLMCGSRTECSDRVVTVDLCVQLWMLYTISKLNFLFSILVT